MCQSATSPDDPGGVWCRECRSLDYRTVDTRPCLEGVLRLHECRRCGARFGSLARFVPLDGRGYAVRSYTALADCLLPVLPVGHTP